jgi:hypothetical protein
MRSGYLNGIEVTGREGSAMIKRFQKKVATRQKAKDFNVWANMYATPYAKRLFQDPYALARAEHSLDSGTKAVAEVKKVADKLVDTKKKQTEVAKESQKAAQQGDMVKAKELAKVEGKIAEKAKVIEGQLATRVSEGVALAESKRVGEKAKAEVDIKKESQAKRYPHLTSFWAKHDALYERGRARLVQKHNLKSLKDDQLKQYLKTMPRGREKDAKIERHRKMIAAKNIKDAQELAKYDSAEAGRIDGREATAK